VSIDRNSDRLYAQPERRKTMTFPTGRFVWFEYVAKDVKKAQGFFGELFNWKTQAMPAPASPGGEYSMIAIDGQTIGGYMVTPEGAPPHAHWISHLQVESAQATAQKVKSLGGKIRKEPTKMGDFGTWAIVADPFDATFALWQPGKPEASEYKGINGAFCWNELTVPDPAKASSFYQQIGGFTEDKKEMPGMDGAYYVLNSEGKPRAGIAKPMKPGVPSMWLPYVAVASADHTSEKAKKLGAQIHVPPTDIPTVGRFSIFADNQGAALGILQPLPPAKK